jgi:hypothetical protein
MLNIPKTIEMRHIPDGEETTCIEVYVDGVKVTEFNKDCRTDIDAESESYLDAVCHFFPDIDWSYT